MKDKFDIKEIITLTVTLFIICLSAAVILGFANNLTQEKIEQNNKEAIAESLRKAMPDASDFIPMFEDGVPDNFPYVDNYTTIYAAKKEDGSDLGWCITTIVKGYNPDINLIVGVTRNLTVEAIDISAHNETPGLGGNITSDWFKDRFKGKSSIVIVKNSPNADNEIQAITSATISSKGIATGVNHALDIAKAILDQEEAVVHE